jgi:hypothetical protein
MPKKKLSDKEKIIIPQPASPTSSKTEEQQSATPPVLPILPPTDLYNFREDLANRKKEFDQLKNEHREAEERWDKAVAELHAAKAELDKLAHKESIKAFDEKLAVHDRFNEPDGDTQNAFGEEGETFLKDSGIYQKQLQNLDEKRKNEYAMHQILRANKNAMEEKKQLLDSSRKNLEIITLYPILLSFSDTFFLEMYISNEKNKELNCNSVWKMRKTEQNFIVHLGTKVMNQHQVFAYRERYQQHADEYNKILLSRLNFGTDNNVYMIYCKYAHMLTHNSLLRMMLEASRKFIFDLEIINKFFQRYIPPESPLPTAKDDLVGLFIYFLCNVLIKFIQLQPVASSFKCIESRITCNNYAVFDICCQIKSPTHLVKNLENELNKINENSSCTLEYDLLALCESLENKVASVERTLHAWMANVTGEKIFKLMVNFLFALENPSIMEACKKQFAQAGLDLFDISVNSDSGVSTIENDSNAIQYFYHHAISTLEINSDLCKKLRCLFPLESIPPVEKEQLEILNKLSIDDFSALGYFVFFISIYYEHTIDLNQFKNKFILFKLEKLDVYFLYAEKIIKQEETEQTTQVTNFLKKQIHKESTKNLIDELEISIAKMEIVEDILKKSKTLKLVTPTDENIKILLAKNEERRASLNELIDKNKEAFELKKQELEKRLASLLPKVGNKLSAKRTTIPVPKKIKKSIDIFYEDLSDLSRNLSKIFSYLDVSAPTEVTSDELHKKRQKINSTLGQITESKKRLADKLINYLPSSDSESFDANAISLQEIAAKIEHMMESPVETKSLDRFELLKKAITKYKSAAEKVSELSVILITQFRICMEETDKILIDASSSNFKKKWLPQAKKISNQHCMLSNNAFYTNKLLCLIQNNDKNVGRENLLFTLLEQNGYQKKLNNLLREKDKKASKSPSKTKKNEARIENNKPTSIEDDPLNKQDEVAHQEDNQIKKRDTKSEIATHIAATFFENTLSSTQTAELHEDSEKSKNRELVEQCNAWITGFVEWITIADPQLHMLFSEVEATSDLLHVSPDYFTRLNDQLNCHKVILIKKLSEIATIIAEFEFSKGQDSLKPCKDKLDNLLKNIDHCSLHIQSIEKIDSNTSSVTERDNHLSQTPESNSAALNDYMKAMVDYNYSTETFLMEENKLSRLYTQGIRRNTLMKSLDQVSIEVLSDLDSTFNQQNIKVNQFAAEVIEHWDNKERIKAVAKAKFSETPEGITLFRCFERRIDPWTAGQEPPLVASLKARRRVVASPSPAYSSVIMHDPQSPTITMDFGYLLKAGFFQYIAPPAAPILTPPLCSTQIRPCYI